MISNRQSDWHEKPSISITPLAALPLAPTAAVVAAAERLSAIDAGGRSEAEGRGSADDDDEDEETSSSGLVSVVVDDLLVSPKME